MHTFKNFIFANVAYESIICNLLEREYNNCKRFELSDFSKVSIECRFFKIENNAKSLILHNRKNACPIKRMLSKEVYLKGSKVVEFFKFTFIDAGQAQCCRRRL